MKRWLSSVVLGAFACGAGRPVAQAGDLERTAAVGEVLTFDASGSRGTISDYQWTFGDGESAAGAKVTHAYGAPGDFEAALEVHGPGGSSRVAVHVVVGLGCSARAVLTVLTPEPRPGAPVLFSAATSMGCASTAISEYQWDFGDDAGVTGGPERITVSHTYDDAGTYPVRLSVTDAFSTVGRATRALVVGTTATPPVVNCQIRTWAVDGRSTAFSANAFDFSGRPIVRYDWTFSDDGSTAAGATVQHTFQSRGEFAVAVTASTDDGRTSIPCTTAVTVAGPPSLAGTWQLSVDAGELTGCKLYSVPFPAEQLVLTHDGGPLSALPSDAGWPVDRPLIGAEQPPPDPPNTFRLRATLPAKVYDGGCGAISPEHVMRITFSTPTTAFGTWSVLHGPQCLPTCSADCGCLATGEFTAALVGP